MTLEIVRCAVRQKNDILVRPCVHNADKSDKFIFTIENAFVVKAIKDARIVLFQRSLWIPVG